MITYAIHNDFHTIQLHTCIQKLCYNIHFGNQVFQCKLNNLNPPSLFHKCINQGLYTPHLYIHYYKLVQNMDSIHFHPDFCSNQIDRLHYHDDHKCSYVFSEIFFFGKFHSNLMDCKNKHYGEVYKI